MGSDEDSSEDEDDNSKFVPIPLAMLSLRESRGEGAGGAVGGGMDGKGGAGGVEGGLGGGSEGGGRRAQADPGTPLHRFHGSSSGIGFIQRVMGMKRESTDGKRDHSNEAFMIPPEPVRTHLHISILSRSHLISPNSGKPALTAPRPLASTFPHRHS